MTSTTPIVLILGACANIGQAVARKFASHGYKVALAARSVKVSDSTESQLNIPSDFARTEDVVKAFIKVKEVFGIPSVVIYNVSASTLTPAGDPFALSLSDFGRDTTINIYSAFIAAQQAVAGFAKLPKSTSPTFIYTGNVLNTAILPRFISQGVGKSGGAHMIWAASEAYKDRGYKFYYADERKIDGSPKYRVDGDAHANLFFDLAQGETLEPWMQTFVKDVGYKAFPSS